MRKNSAVKRMTLNSLHIYLERVSWNQPAAPGSEPGFMLFWVESGSRFRLNDT